MPSALAAGLLEGAAGADFGADELVVDRWEDALPEFLGFVDGADERVERVAVLEVEQHLADAQGDVRLAGTAGQVGEALNPVLLVSAQPGAGDDLAVSGYLDVRHEETPSNPVGPSAGG